MWSNPNHALFRIHLILNPSHFILLIFVLHLRNHLKMSMNLIPVTQAAPLPIRMKHVLWRPHVTICFIWILPAIHLNYKTTELNLFLILKTYFNWILPGSHLKTNPALKLNLFLNQKGNWTTFHQQIFSLNTMSMNCSCYERRLMHHMTISTIRTVMSVKRTIKITSSFMPPTLATILHYPNSWHNTTVKT